MESLSVSHTSKKKRSIAMAMPLPPGTSGSTTTAANKQRVSVLYYICRNGQLEHPHLMEVTLSSPNGLFLRDVIDRLNVLRGNGMATLYSWSCKRGYKNGFVWNDLSEDDLIFPVHGPHEYVLKGSEIIPPPRGTDPSSRRRRNHSCGGSIDFSPNLNLKGEEAEHEKTKEEQEEVELSEIEITPSASNSSSGTVVEESPTLLVNQKPRDKEKLGKLLQLICGPPGNRRSLGLGLGHFIQWEPRRGKVPTLKRSTTCYCGGSNAHRSNTSSLPIEPNT